jgi:UDP-N-acetylmuramate dehydrogenase
MDIFEGLEHIVRPNEPLAPHTWLRLGGPAQYFAEPTSKDELQELLRRCREEDLPVRILGGGSNLLVRDEGVPGLVISLAAPAFSGISVDLPRITAGGGARLGHVISTAVRDGLSGLETLVGIPGTVGGALRANATAHGTDIGQWTHSVTVLTRSGELRTYAHEELRFSYRMSNLDDQTVLEATFELEPTNTRELTQRMQKLWIVKKAEQPLSSQNAASVFANPSWASAASLIEQAGLKETRVGQAEISDRNANYIVVNPGASAKDVLRLVELMRTKVAEQLGVELELALEIW